MIENININSDVGVAAALEAKRISEKYDKDFLDCEDIVTITGLGKDNIRALMRSDDFPTAELDNSNRKVVSVIGFAIWSVKKLL
ncbi:MAG: hypothetical protein FWE04_06770 [Oscillospiraceae bacterium]|nr:hypothetical protein [Oscillospiraceae bacterium]